MRFDDIARQIDALLVEGNALCLERAAPLLTEIHSVLASLSARDREAVRPALRERTLLWKGLLEGARKFRNGWRAAVAENPETYTAGGAARAHFASGRLRVEG